MNPKLLVIYDKVEPLGNGLYACKLDDKYTLVNEDCERLSEEYAIMRGFYKESGLIEVGQAYNQTGLINSKGREVMHLLYSNIEADGRGRIIAISYASDTCRIYDYKGHMLFDTDYSKISAMPDGYYKVQRGSYRGNTLEGIADEELNELVPATYQELMDMGNGLLRALKNNNYGIINFNNRIIVDFKFDTMNIGFVNGVTQAKMDNKFYYVSDKGKVIAMLDDYDEVVPMGTGAVCAGRKGDKWRLISAAGNVLSAKWYDNIAGLKR